MIRIKTAILMISLLLLSSCIPVNTSSQTNDNIVTPKASKHSVQGTWGIESKEQIADSSNGKADLEKGDELYFDPELVLMKSRYTTTPVFSSKYVNGKNYFLYKYGNHEAVQAQIDKNLEVISISDGERFYQDILMLDHNTILFVYSGDLYRAKRKSDTVDKNLITEYIALDREILSGSKSLERIDTALLLGIRTADEIEGRSVNNYHTYFIRKNEEGNITVYLTRDLFIPRQNSYWTAEHFMDYTKEPLEVIKAKDIGIKENSKNSISSKNKLITTFVDPNYISYMDTKEGEPGSDYNMKELDNLSGEPLKITDLAGATGLKILSETTSKEAAGLGIDPKEIDVQEEVENIGIVRENGKWVFATYLHYEKEGSVKTKKVNLNIVPNNDIDMDSEKNFSWAKIKNMVPDAIDAVSSPKEDLIVIQSPDELLIYSHEDTVYPIASIPLYGSSSIVMEEWASERFSSLWEEAFKSTERIPVEYSINQ